MRPSDPGDSSATDASIVVGLIACALAAHVLPAQEFVPITDRRGERRLPQLAWSRAIQAKGWLRENTAYPSLSATMGSTVDARRAGTLS